MVDLIDIAREFRLAEHALHLPGMAFSWLEGRDLRLFSKVELIHASRDGDFVEQANFISWREILVETKEKYPGSLFRFGDNVIVRSFDTPLDESGLAPECEEIIKTWIGLHDYPCIDDTLASRLEYDAQCESIKGAYLADHDLNESVLPEDWVSKVWRLLWDRQDEQGVDLLGRDGHVDSSVVEAALKYFGWVHLDSDEWLGFLSRKSGAGDGTKPEP